MDGASNSALPQVTFGSEDLASRQGEATNWLRTPSTQSGCICKPEEQHIALHCSTGALTLTITRILGISFGVLLSEIVSVVVFPKSATQEALGLAWAASPSLPYQGWPMRPPSFRPSLLRPSLPFNLYHLSSLPAFQDLQPSPLDSPPSHTQRLLLLVPPVYRMADNDSPGCRVLATLAAAHKYSEENWLDDAEERERRFEEECELLLMETYTSLYKVQDLLPQVSSCALPCHANQSGALTVQGCLCPSIEVQYPQRLMPIVADTMGKDTSQPVYPASLPFACIAGNA